MIIKASLHPGFQAIVDYAINVKAYAIPSYPNLVRLNKKYTALAESGILANLQFYYQPLTGDAGTGTQDFAKLNWVDPSTFEITVHGTVAYDGNVGWTPNGTTGYLNTHCVPASPYTQNSASFGMSIGSNTTKASSSDIGASNNANGVNDGVFLSARSGGSDLLQARINDSTTFSLATQTNSLAIYNVNRTASNARKMRKNGLIAVSDTTASTSVTTREVYLGASNGNGTATRFSDRVIEDAWLGGGMTDEQIYNLEILTYKFLAVLPGHRPTLGRSMALLPSNLYTWSSGKQPRDPSNIIRWEGKYYFYAGKQTQDIGFDDYDSTDIHVFEADRWEGPYTDLGSIWAARVGEWDSGIVYTPNAVVAKGKVYVFYTGEDHLGVSTQGGNIGAIESTSPTSGFTASQADPILGNSADGFDAGALPTYENWRLDACCPLQMSDGSWRMYYKSVKDTAGVKTKFFNYATTSEADFPLNWVRASSTPFFSNANTSAGQEPENPTIFYEEQDAVYYMIMHENDYTVFRIFSSANGVTSWSAVRDITIANVGGTQINGYATYMWDGNLRGIILHEGPNSSNPTTDVRRIIGLGRTDFMNIHT